MTIDWGLVVSTLLSPLLAVQVTRLLDARSARNAERRRIFQTLMATRGRFLDVRHVEALNVIDVVFGGRGRKLAAVRSAWRAYLHHLEPRGMPDAVWVPKRNELFVDLLHAMATYLHFEFDKTTLGSQALFPGGWGRADSNQVVIQEGLAKIASGEVALPVVIRPPVPAATAAHTVTITTPGATANIQASAAATGAAAP